MHTFEHTIRVRYAETDAMGVAHHGAYVVWLEEARIEALRGLGHSYAALEAQGVLMPVIDLRLRYRKSLRFDDQVLLCTTLSMISSSRICFNSSLQLAGEMCAEAAVTVATVDPSGRPQRIPAELKEILSRVHHDAVEF